MVYRGMKHLAEKLIFVFPSYYTNNLFTDETPKVLPCSLFSKSPYPIQMVESGIKPTLFIWQLSSKI